jgi:predicted O-methyltransferase YrrM
VVEFNKKGYFMIEKIGKPGSETLSKPNSTVLKYLDAILMDKQYPIFYEIGVGFGATTLPVAKRMNNNGSILLFSRKNHVIELASDLLSLGYHNVDSTWGSPSKTYSGYHFELARGMAENLLPCFDLAYIDGGHVFHLDAPASCILKELCKPGGYMIFDDYRWSIAKSPTLNPSKRLATSSEYDDRQIDACHVQLVCKTIMEPDRRFEFVGLEGNTAIYRRYEDEDA